MNGAAVGGSGKTLGGWVCPGLMRSTCEGAGFGGIGPFGIAGARSGSDQIGRQRKGVAVKVRCAMSWTGLMGMDVTGGSGKALTGGVRRFGQTKVWRSRLGPIRQGMD